MSGLVGLRQLQSNLECTKIVGVFKLQSVKFGCHAENLDWGLLQHKCYCLLLFLNMLYVIMSVS